jgi:hypothetical protein
MEYDQWEKLLRKEIKIPDGLEEGTRLWFEAIQDFSDEPFEVDWTTEEYFDGWKAMSEDKSSLPGIQAAHLKSVEVKDVYSLVIKLKSFVLEKAFSQ